MEASDLIGAVTSYARTGSLLHKNNTTVAQIHIVSRHRIGTKMVNAIFDHDYYREQNILAPANKMAVVADAVDSEPFIHLVENHDGTHYYISATFEYVDRGGRLLP